MRKTDAALLATGAVIAAALAGSRHRPSPDEPRNMVWYVALDKPSFRPSGPVIGGAWMVLDILLAYSGTRLLAAPPSQRRSMAVTGWAATVSGVAAYPYLMFGRRWLGAALGSVVTMLGAALTTIVVGAPVDRRAAGALLPLVAWLGFAGVLQEEIWRRNH